MDTSGQIDDEEASDSSRSSDDSSLEIIEAGCNTPINLMPAHKYIYKPSLSRRATHAKLDGFEDIKIYVQLLMIELRILMLPVLKLHYQGNKSVFPGQALSKARSTKLLMKRDTIDVHVQLLHDKMQGEIKSASSDSSSSSDTENGLFSERRQMQRNQKFEQYRKFFVKQKGLGG